MVTSRLCGHVQRSPCRGKWKKSRISPVLSPTLSVNTSSPDVTQCFQDTAMTWVSCGVFLIIAPFYALYLSSVSSHQGPRSIINKIKLGLGVTLIGVCFIEVVLSSVYMKNNTSTLAALFAALLRLLSTVVATVFCALEYRKRFQTSALLCVFWLIQVIFGIVSFRSLILQWTAEVEPPGVWKMVCFYTSFCLIFLTFITTSVADASALQRTCLRRALLEEETTPLLASDNPYGRADVNKQSDGPLSPSLTASFFSIITFAWIIPFLIRGFKRPSEYRHLHQLKDEDTTADLLPSFYKFFSDDRQERTQLRGEKNPTWRLCKSLLLTMKWDVFISFMLRLIAIVFQFITPQLIRLLIAYVGDASSQTWQGLGLAAILFVVNFSVTMLIHWWSFYGFVIGMRIRTVINAITYRKVIQLSSTARRTTTVGEIVNLMSVDAQKLQDVPGFIHLGWSFPLMTALSLYFLYQTVGVAAFAGIAILVGLLPINALFLGNKIRQLQVKQMVEKDNRVRVVNEVLSGIKVLKFYAWEPSFQKKICDIRDKELHYLRRAASYNAISSVTWFLAPYLVSLVVFGTYVMTGDDHVLDADKAFVSMTLINLLNFPIAQLPLAVSVTGQGIVSLSRVANFLALDEIDGNTSARIQNGFVDDSIAVDIKEATFSWGDDPPVLNNVNMKVKKGALVAVVGQVGSGKSSLISAILGEMKRCQGHISITGSVAYVPQQAWIQNATLRDNILFGRPPSSRYGTVLQACALKPDMEILQGGDMTEIGEKGINLSGGQKQRVSLARAVYQDQDVYIMDDPLSAVDAHVGKELFDQVIGPNGLLKHKTRILVTHGVRYLPLVDQIIVMTDGRLSEMGTYQQLVRDQGEFSNFLNTYMDERSSDDELEAIIREDGDNKSMVSDDTSPRNLRRRRSTIQRHASMESSLTKSLTRQDSTKLGTTQLMTEELAMAGTVGWPVIGTYAKAGGLLFLVVVICCHIGFSAATVVTNIWLTAWTNDPVYNGTRDSQEVNYRLGVYGGLGCVQVLLIIIESIVIAIGCIQASRTLHHQVLQRILHAPMSFFDTTPLGRILNRFSKDLDIIDVNIPVYIRFWLFNVAPLVSTLVIIIYTTPPYIVVVLPVGFIFYFIQKMIVVNINRLKRLDSVLRSPIYAHFDESVTGLASIRAYQKEEEFTVKCDRLVDDSQRAWYLYFVTARWLGIWMEMVGCLMVFFAAVFAVLQRDVLTASMAGLSISFSLQLTLFLNVTIRSTAEMETYMVSVERMKEYREVDQEAPWVVENANTAGGWPTEGRVQMTNYSTRYRRDLNLVLKAISCDIQPRERVGIVGRTGAGKSSLTLSLFRIIEAAEGAITIDNVRIADLGLHQLRKRLTIIPQDPVLFSGTLRGNMDPFETYSDHEVWRALEHAHLKSFVAELSDGLEYEVGDNGEALSVGQRQLVCLARALLHKTKILILDEATAAVDMETDDLIQHTIRSEFTECTIITIAHRINTVLDYDRILVFDDGVIVEQDSPQALLLNEESAFCKMATDAGITGTAS